MIAGLGLVRARRRRTGGEIRDAYAVTAHRNTDMLLLAQVIIDLANGQSGAGQAEIGLHDMLGAVRVRDRCAGADAQRDLD
jgi:hypothetical protein